MKYIVKQSKPPIAFVLLVLLILSLFIVAPSFHFVLKVLTVILAIYIIDNNFLALIENNGRLQIHKGFVFKRKKNIEISEIKKITINIFNNKGGYGLEMFFFMDDNKKITFVKQSAIDEIDNDVKNINEYFLQKNIKIIINKYKGSEI